jgi:hypothetical protein
MGGKVEVFTIYTLCTFCFRIHTHACSLQGQTLTDVSFSTRNYTFPADEERDEVATNGTHLCCCLSIDRHKRSKSSDYTYARAPVNERNT